MIQTSATFRSKNHALVTRAVEIASAEHPITLRGLFYRLISAGELQNSQLEYRRLGQVMTRLRESGDVPRTWIVDHLRATLKPSSWSGLADFADTVRHAYRKDFWASLWHHVEVFVEKDAIAGTIQPVTEAYDVALRVCRGYASISFAGEIADSWGQIEKPIFVYYLGDFDPSGFDLERDLREKIERYSGCVSAERRMSGRYTDSIGTYVWQRLGERQDDFEDHDLIHLAVKQADKRTPGFIRDRGTSCAEIDAIAPTELRRRVEAAITGHIDADQWARLRTIEEAEQETLNRLVLKLGVRK